MATVTNFPTEDKASTALLMELRTSLEAGHLTWALAQADYALHGRVIPEKITDLHHQERRRYEDLAVLALRLCDRDAWLFAELKAKEVAFEVIREALHENGMTWLDDGHASELGDALEIAARHAGKRAVDRFRETLQGTFGELSTYLAHLDTTRRGDVYDRR